jgi:hypothetical protein
MKIGCLFMFMCIQGKGSEIELEETINFKKLTFVGQNKFHLLTFGHFDMCISKKNLIN